MRQSRRVAAAPPEVRFLALLTLGAAGACAVGAAAPVAPGRPVALLVAAAVGSVVLAALLVLSGPRITPLALSAVVGVMIVGTSCLVASATTSAGAMLAGYAYVWLTVYSALFLPPRATQAHALMITIGFGLGLLIVDFSATFTAWLLVSGTVWVSGLTLSGLSARVRRQAETDDLTGLLNRRAWSTELSRELARADRNGAPLCVAVLDLDRFKQYNDTHGHHAGDRFLKQVAGIWSAALRGTDILARHGGEEFAVAMPETDLDGAEEMLERLREAVPSDETCSAGVCLWDGNESAEALLDRADTALYGAKAAGRDQVSAS